MIHAKKENISGVMYRCRERGANLGDPENLPNFGIWASSVRVHMVQRHQIVSTANKPLNDLVAAFFIWTTPTGHEVVTTGVR